MTSLPSLKLDPTPSLQIFLLLRIITTLCGLMAFKLERVPIGDKLKNTAFNFITIITSLLSRS
jgi:hypothetical protein